MTVEARIHFSGKGEGRRELLRLLLVKSGVPDEKIVEKEEKGRTSLSVFLESAAGARKAAAAVRALRLRGISLSLVPVRPGWKTNWKKYFKPFFIAPGLRIIPVWEKLSSAPGEEGIRIDTTLAFGTGLHATTRMMAGFIRANRGHLSSFLDVGTGSGILSLIACRYGAGKIWAMDFDPLAVKTARRNFLANKCPAGHLSVADFALYDPGRRFSFIAANLFTEDLVRFRQKLTSLLEPGGLLAVSGIFSDNYPSLIRRFKVRGLCRLETVRRGKWYALLFRKEGGRR